MKGPCYPAAEAIYHMMCGKYAGLTPMRIVHEGIPHWYLRWEANGSIMYIDPTSTQFSTPVPYEKGRGCGFMTKQPSRRARLLMKEVS